MGLDGVRWDGSGSGRRNNLKVDDGDILSYPSFFSVCSLVNLNSYVLFFCLLKAGDRNTRESYCNMGTFSVPVVQTKQQTFLLFS